MKVSRILFVVMSLVLVSGCSTTGHRHRDMEQTTRRLEERVDSLGTSLRETIASVRGSITSAEDKLRDLDRSMQGLQRGFASYAIPDQVIFGGFGIQFDTPEKKRRLDEAIMFMINNQARLQLIYARAWQYFPLIDRLLDEEGMAGDYKYVAVVESGLNERARSLAHASGPWQFMPATGAERGLQQTTTVDERRNLEKSTRVAAQYLHDLLSQFQDVLLALASYNRGEGNIADAIKSQGVRDYFLLWLPQETEEYVLKVFAAKLIFEDPGKYGVVLETRPYWQRVEKDTVTVKVSKRLSARMVADWCGTVYREIRLLNPELLSDAWGPGTYVVSLPKGERRKFLEGLKALRGKK